MDWATNTDGVSGSYVHGIWITSQIFESKSYPTPCCRCKKTLSTIVVKLGRVGRCLDEYTYLGGRLRRVRKNPSKKSANGVNIRKKRSSYNRIGKDAEEADVEEIINMASTAALADQERQVQENIHSQITNFCTSMDQILLPDSKPHDESSQKNTSAPRRSGLSLAVGRNTPTNTDPDVPETKQLTFAESSQRLKDMMGYTLELKPSKVPHEQAGRGLFIVGEADVGSVIALYPGVIYSPTYYRYIPGYPRVDAQNPYLITRYDGTVL